MESRDSAREALVFIRDAADARLRGENDWTMSNVLRFSAQAVAEIDARGAAHPREADADKPLSAEATQWTDDNWKELAGRARGWGWKCVGSDLLVWRADIRWRGDVRNDSDDVLKIRLTPEARTALAEMLSASAAQPPKQNVSLSPNPSGAKGGAESGETPIPSPRAECDTSTGTSAAQPETEALLEAVTEAAKILRYAVTVGDCVYACTDASRILEAAKVRAGIIVSDAKTTIEPA